MAAEEAQEARDDAEGAAEPGDEGLVQRLLPKTPLALAAVVFFMGLAAALTGAVLYAYYESRLEKTEQAIDDFVGNYTDEFDSALGELQAERDAALARIDDTLQELDQFAAGGETLAALAERTAPSVWFVSTLDDVGAPSVGSAFVVFADGEASYLLTDLDVVRASTVEPGPGLTIRKGDRELEAELFTWDDATRLALLRVTEPRLPALGFVDDPGSVNPGDRTFVVSGLGANGVSVSQGSITDAAANAIQHDAGVGAAHRGGPLLDADGRVIGVASRTYAPLGFDPLAVFFAPPIRLACETVIRCPDGEVTPAG
jgi:S1-C subfamily serine protease